MILRRWGTVLIHSQFLVALWRRFLSWPPASYFCLASSAISTLFCSLLATRLARSAHSLWPTYSREEPLKRKSTRSTLTALEVLYALSVDNLGSGIHNLTCLMLWPMIYRKLALISSPPNRAGMILSLRAYSMGPIRVPTPGTVLCRYCNFSCNNITNPAYSEWECCQASLPKTLTPWAHAST